MWTGAIPISCNAVYLYLSSGRIRLDSVNAMSTSHEALDAALVRSDLRQVALPLFAPFSSELKGVVFAHPAEQELARILSFFGIDWAYEPTSFALAWRADGTPSEMFTPDFYLPELNLYLELTTMRQRLVTRKNRKARLLRERYPNIRLRLLYRRDYLRLAESYRGMVESPDGSEVQGVVRTEVEIAAAVEAMAHRILARYARLPEAEKHDPVIVTTTSGSRVFERDLLAALRRLGANPIGVRIATELPVAYELQSKVRATADVRSLLESRSIVMVDTLVSTGLNLSYSQQWLRKRGAHLIGSMALFARAGTRIAPVELDHVAFDAPNEVLAGYGLQLRGALAELPYVATVKPAEHAPPVSKMIDALGSTMD